MSNQKPHFDLDPSSGPHPSIEAFEEAPYPEITRSVEDILRAALLTTVDDKVAGKQIFGGPAFEESELLKMFASLSSKSYEKSKPTDLLQSIQALPSPQAPFLEYLDNPKQPQPHPMDVLKRVWSELDAARKAASHPQVQSITSKLQSDIEQAFGFEG